jgi:hypothetical protein
MALVIPEGQRKNEPKQARFSDRVADFNSPRGELPHLYVRCMKEVKMAKRSYLFIE